MAAVTLTGRMSGYKARERLLAYGMMAPAAVLFITFLIVPFLMAFGLKSHKSTSRTASRDGN